MKPTCPAIGLLLVQVVLMATGDAKIIRGHLTTASNFQFVDRFCFQPNEEGSLQYEIKYKAADCCYKLLMFNDEPGQWPYIREHGQALSCGEKKEVIPGAENAKLTLQDPYNGCQRYNDSDGVEYMLCTGGRSFETVRARWWFIVMSNCYSDDGIDFEFHITMTNGVKFWDKHFSADERYILETDMTFLFVYFAMLLITAYFTKILADRNLLHSTYKLFIWSMLAEFSSLLLLTIALGKYGSTGVCMHGLEVLANLIGAAGILVFILMIVLLGKGFTVTRAKVVNGMERAVTCGGHIFFLLLTRPNAANRNFPFHIKTTQIGTISGGDGSDAHNATAAYTVRRDSSQAVNLSFTDLFVTDKTPKEKKTVIKMDPLPTALDAGTSWCDPVSQTFNTSQ